VGFLVDRTQMERLLVLTGALEAGLIDVLARGQGTTAEVAAAGASDERATRIILEALADIGVVEASGTGSSRVFRLTADGRAHLVEPGPNFERYSLLHQARKARGWLELPYVIAHGRPPDDGRERRQPFSFGRAMAESDPLAADEVVDAVLTYAGISLPAGSPAPASEAVPGRPRVIDVGGALGHMALRFALRGLAATLFDRPAMIEEARRAREGLAAQMPGGVEAASRLEYVAGDFNEALPAGPFDIVYVGNILHIYGAELNEALVKRAFATLASAGVIAVRDYVWEHSPRSPLFAVNMLQATEAGEVWREADFRRWLESAGCADVAVVDLKKAPNQLVLGRRE